MAFDDIQNVNQPLQEEEQLQNQSQIEQSTNQSIDKSILPVVDFDNAEQQDPPSSSQSLYRYLIADKKKDGTPKYTKDDLGSEDDFITAITNPENAKNIYAQLKKDGYTIEDIGEEKDFLSTFATEKKKGGTESKTGIIEPSQSELPYPSRVPKEVDGKPLQIPQPEPETDPNDLFKLAKKAKALKATAGTISVSGGTGGAGVTTIVDQSKIDDSNRINTQIKIAGYDPDKLANDSDGISDAFFKQPGFSYSDLLSDYKNNQQLYERKIATAKWQSSLYNQLRTENPENAKQLNTQWITAINNISNPKIGRAHV